jgi:hypothetical protein
MEKHRQYKDYPGSVEEQEQEDPAVEAERITQQLSNIEEWKPHNKTQQHQDLSSGNVIRRKDITEVTEGKSSAGISSAVVQVDKIDLEDNGSGLVKPPLPGYPHSSANEVGGCVIHEVYGSPNNMGTTGTCPTTTYRVEDNTKKSAQAWVYKTDAAVDLYKAAIDSGKEKNPKTPISAFIKFMLKRSPNPEKTRADMEEAACADIISCNTDRHWGNMLFDGEGNGYAIDHGFTFARGMVGYRNHFHMGMNKNGMKVRVTDAMRTKIENTTFNQLLGSLSEHVTPWRAAQSFLRSHYLLDVQDEFEELPYEYLGGTLDGGGIENYVGMVNTRYDDPTTFITDGNTKFEAFAIGWIDDRVADPSHPEHETAKRFQEEGIFMNTLTDRGGRKQGDNERNVGGHFEYEKFARSHQYLMTPEAAKDAKTIQEAVSLSRTAIENEMVADLDKIVAEKDQLLEEMEELRARPFYDQPVEVRKDIDAAIARIPPALDILNLQKRQTVSRAGDKMAADKVRVVGAFVPPGMEELYKTLDKKIADLAGGKKPPLNISLNTGTAPSPFGSQPATKQVTQAPAPNKLAAAVQALRDKGPINLQTEESMDPNAPSGTHESWWNTPLVQSPAASIESSKQLRGFEVALSHHGKMLKDAKRDLKRMKRGVPSERKAQLQGKVKALEAQGNQMQEKFDKLQAKRKGSS